MTQPVPDPYGPIPQVVTSIHQMAPSVLEEIAQAIEVRGIRTPISQVVGFSQFSAQTATVGAEAHGTNIAYADPNVSGGPGPQIAGLHGGSYVVLFGGSGTGTLASNTVCHMAVSVNGATPSDSDACEFQQDGHCSGSRAITVTLTGEGNTLKCLYRTSDGTDRGDVRYRWMTILRYLG